jgi:putative ABC transport system substrate-binding protein
MNRRRFLLTTVAGALAAPLGAEAQPAGKTYRIALAHPSAAVSDMAEGRNRHFGQLFSELRRLGYVEGQNLVVERRSAAGRTERFPELARDVVQLHPHLILAVSSRLIRHLKSATTVIPIVGITGDPVAAGIVVSLAAPGGNITGFAGTPGDEIYAKHFGLMREAVPEATRVAFLAPKESWEGRDGHATREAARRAGVTLVGTPLADPIQESEYQRAFAVMTREGVKAVLVGNDPENFTNRQIILELAAQRRLPAIFHSREFVEAGGLMFYGVDVTELYRRAAGTSTGFSGAPSRASFRTSSRPSSSS